MKQVLVVGGFHKFVMGKFRERLKPYGVEVGWHVAPLTGGAPYTGIPTNCEAVIVLADCVSHPLGQQALADGKAADLPSVYADQRWSLAESTLRIAGIIGGSDVNTTLVVPNPETIKKTAAQFIADEAKKSPRIPTLEELNVAVRRILQSEAISIPQQWMKEILGLAHAKTFKPVFSDQDLRDAVRAEVETNLETLWDFKMLSDRIQAQFGSILPGNSRILKEEVETILKRWALPNSCQTPKEREFRYQSLKNWLQTRIELSQANGGKGWPANDSTCKFLKEHGIACSDKMLARLRIDVLGSWAGDLKNFTCIQNLYPNLDLKNLIAKKMIKTVLIPWKTGPVLPWTSRQAVEEYLEGLRKIAPGVAALVSTPPEAPKAPEAPAEVDPVPVIVTPGGDLGLTPVPPKVPTSSDNLALAAMVTEDVTRKLEELLVPIRNEIVAIREDAAKIKVPDPVVMTPVDPAKKSATAVILEKLEALTVTVNFLASEVTTLKDKGQIPTNKDHSDSLAETLRTAEHYEVKLTK